MRAALTVRPGEVLARHTPLRTGGPCDVWVVAHTLAGLLEVMRDCRAEKWAFRLIGAGTRTIVRDGGIRGAVVRLGTAFSSVEPVGDAWEVGAAAPMPALIELAKRAGAGGLHAFGCVPGTLGASLALDAGWADLVETVWGIQRGREREVALDVAVAKGLVLTRARLRLPPLDRRRERLLDRARRDGRPVPAGGHYRPIARKSIRGVLGTVALPRVRLRQVLIPRRAPELLVNLGGGTAADAALLRKSAIDRVRRVRGIALEDRMQWIGSR